MNVKFRYKLVFLNYEIIKIIKMDFDFPNKLQEIPVLLIIPITVILKSVIKNDLLDKQIKISYTSLIKYLEIFIFFGLIILSLFDKFLAVFTLICFFLYSLDQSIRLISLGIKQIFQKARMNNSKIIIIGILILSINLLLCYISIKNIAR